MIYYWHAPAAVSPVAAELTSISDDGWMGGALKSGGPFIQSPTGQVITLYGHDNAVHAGSLVNAVSRHGWAAVCGASYGITPDWYVIGDGWDANFTPASEFAWVWFPEKGTQRLPGLAAGLTTSVIAINSLHHVLGLIGGQTVIWKVGPRP